jgi:dipeptide/tripeptide permease
MPMSAFDLVYPCICIGISLCIANVLMIILVGVYVGWKAAVIIIAVELFIALLCGLRSCIGSRYRDKEIERNRLQAQLYENARKVEEDKMKHINQLEYVSTEPPGGINMTGSSDKV